MLGLYRRALRIRAAHPGFAGESFRWLNAPEGVLLFEREDQVACVVNLSARAFPLSTRTTTLLRSDAGAPDGADLPPDTAAWDRRPAALTRARPAPGPHSAEMLSRSGDAQP
jgi:alpha-glucosidase